ncbi:MAG: putative glycolipid-binding domain-containing protein [Gaiellaceae bacterium]
MSDVLWVSSQGGMERCVLERTEGGRRLRGTALLAVEGAPVEARYTVDIDPSWRTTDVSVVVEFAGGDVREPALLGELWSGKERPPELEGCLDVDLGFSPSTNTLPIRRLGLPVGEAADVAAVWLRWPDLTVERLDQRYDRIGRDLYRYSSGRFSSVLKVDEEGLVLEYGDYWRVVASA